MLSLRQMRGVVLLGGISLLGCGAAPEPASQTSSPPAAASPAASAPSASPAAAVEAAPSVTPVPAPPPRISLSGGGPTASSSTDSTSAPAGTASYTRQEVLAALKPMQILRDEWNGVRQKSVGGQDAGEDFSWIWDHRSNRQQPALVMSSPKGKYFHQLRLTYDPSVSQFQMTMTDADDQERSFAGDYSVPVEEVQMGDKKVHRVYKLQLDEADSAEAKDQWQIVLNQQENNRYLLEMSRKRGGKWQRFETISAQRKGTSFALSDTDYGDRTCVISGGLGTMQVSFQGKSYWVCCTGCQAAFNEEPARWIAEFEAKQKAEKQ